MRPTPGDGRPFGLIIAEGNDTFVIVGRGFTADFSTASHLAEVDHVEEGHYDVGVWKDDRVLNGDERLSIIPADRIGMVRIRLLPRPRS